MKENNNNLEKLITKISNYKDLDYCSKFYKDVQNLIYSRNERYLLTAIEGMIGNIGVKEYNNIFKERKKPLTDNPFDYIKYAYIQNKLGIIPKIKMYFKGNNINQIPINQNLPFKILKKIYNFDPNKTETMFDVIPNEYNIESLQ